MTEHEIQCDFFRKLKTLALIYPELELFHAIPNGGKRTLGTAIKLKREGVKAGVPDTHLPVPSGEYCGLYIEFKRAEPKTYMKPIKKALAERLREVGNCVEVARSSSEAIAITEQYMRGEI